jgi:hypothetical protein
MCSGCIEPYTPEIDKYEDILIIDGLITDQPYSIVRLSRGSYYNQSESIPEGGATVIIGDDLGNVISMYEESPGIYRSLDPDFEGIIGRNYRIYVYTDDDQGYESDFVELKKVPEIENLYTEFGEKAVGTDLEKGFYVYVDTYDPDNETRYYRYEFEETWEFSVPYTSFFELVGRTIQMRSVINRQCWRTELGSDILLASSEKMESDMIRHFPVHFVSIVGSRLSRRYSILVRQYSVNAEAYVFWNQLKINNQNLGTLFDKQPAQIYGNIHSMDGNEAPVLGFFEASSMKSKRIFLENKDLPPDVLTESEFAFCRHDYLIVSNRRALDYALRGYCIVGEEVSPQFGQGMGVILNHKCCDCTLNGSNIRPDFW